MCGIAGAIAEIGHGAMRQVLDASVTALRHRGPDDEGWWSAATGRQSVGMCATRLAVRDTSTAGHQPMISPRTGAVLCFNGEIYNLDDLRERLRAAGHRFRGRSDTEAVLAAYDQWGPDCVHQLDGMFAIAIWVPDRRRLYLARDRLGIKPLYYRERDGGIAFASEVRALLAAGLSPRSLSPAGVNSYLALGAVIEPETIAQDVRLLPAAHWATWTPGEPLRATEYWSLSSTFGQNSTLRDRDQAVSILRDLLPTAMRSHLQSDVPIGVFLSGGIDSAALVALATQVADGPVHTASLVFDEATYSEAPYIRLVSERFGTRHTELRLDAQAFLALLPDALAAMDQPTVDGVNVYVISRVARESGLHVAVSGLGGDELFGGYKTFRDVPRLTRAAHVLPRSVRAGATAASRWAIRHDRADKLARCLNHDHSDLASVYTIYRELFSPAATSTLVEDHREPLLSGREEALSLDGVNAVSYLELSHYLRNVLLRDADVMSMAHGLELRVPFLDRRLVEYTAGLSGTLKLMPRAPKALLVDALGGSVPAQVVKRAKRGFTLPFDAWLRNDLKREVEAMLLDSSAGGQVAESLNPEAVAGVWRDFLDRRLHWSRPWALYVLKCWGAHHVPA